MPQRVTKQLSRKTTPRAPAGSTGTIGADGIFVPDPPGTSIFSPARFTQGAGMARPSTPRKPGKRAVKPAGKPAPKKKTQRA